MGDIVQEKKNQVVQWSKQLATQFRCDHKIDNRMANCRKDDIITSYHPDNRINV